MPFPNLKNDMSKRELKIVLVYLGEKIPRYVISNVNYIAKFFDFEVFLFIEQGAIFPTEIQINDDINVKELTPRENNVDKLFGHDVKFRKGYWLHTFKRLFQLLEIHRELGDEKRGLHVEADMLIMPTFPFNEVLGEKLKWFRYNQVSDVASLVYLPSIQETKWLINQLYQELESDSMATDMSALKRIRDKNPDRIEIFHDLFANHELNKSVDVFDGLSLGMWLCGVDPRNTFGMSFIHENNDYSPDGNATLGYLLGESNFFLQNSQIILSSESNNQIIHCLHIHSKDEKILSLEYLEGLKEYLTLSGTKKPIVVKFNIRIFSELILDNMRNQTFISYLRNLFRFLLKNDSSTHYRFFTILAFLIKSSRGK